MTAQILLWLICLFLQSSSSAQNDPYVHLCLCVLYRNGGVGGWRVLLVLQLSRCTFMAPVYNQFISFILPLQGRF